MPLAVGSLAPHFSLPDEHGDMRSLSDFSGMWLLLYFYPKDDTPGCTKEACGLRDWFKKYEKAGCRVVGMSADAPESHAKFVKKYDLPFSLLSDESKKTIEAYDAWQQKSFMGKKYMGIVRMSYLIDPKGLIAKIYPEVSPEEHAQEVLNDLAELKK